MLFLNSDPSEDGEVFTGLLVDWYEISQLSLESSNGELRRTCIAVSLLGRAARVGVYLKFWDVNGIEDVVDNGDDDAKGAVGVAGKSDGSIKCIHVVGTGCILDALKRSGPGLGLDWLDCFFIVSRSPG